MPPVRHVAERPRRLRRLCGPPCGGAGFCESCPTLVAVAAAARSVGIGQGVPRFSGRAPITSVLGRLVDRALERFPCTMETL